MSAQIKPRIQPATEPVCCGTCCPQRGACQLYAAMEQREEDTPVIDTCIDGGGRWPMFKQLSVCNFPSCLCAEILLVECPRLKGGV